MDFNLTQAKRQEVLTTVTNLLEGIYNDPRRELTVSKDFDPETVRAEARGYSFNQSNDVEDVMKHAVAGLKEYSIHVTHPSYLGLFNPRPNFPSALADVINSYLNPQLAAWSHSPFAVEIEQYVIREFGKKFGYYEEDMDGVFCIGGTESNLTAVLTALQQHFPQLEKDGLQNLNKQPVIYLSSESHHSMERAARTAGLGTKAVRQIPVNSNLTMDTEALRRQIDADLAIGKDPFMVIGTAGTTGAGAFDNLEEIAKICAEYNLWFHVDAAYGGGAVITEAKHVLNGIEKSDSITLDLHKWFSVPMATSIYLSSKKGILSKTFNLQTKYMPEDGNPNQIFDSYVNSLQWSRRFIGLKIYLPLAVFGWEGYRQVLSHQIEMGNNMRELLKENGWEIMNESEVPIICFTHPDLDNDKTSVQKIVDELNSTGQTWMSSYPIHGKLTLRVQITNYETKVEDIEKFIDALEACKTNIFNFSA